MKEQLTVREFVEYCNEKGFDEYILDSENTEFDGVCFDLKFNTVKANYDFKSISFISENGKMRIHGVKFISLCDEIVGTVCNITCGFEFSEEKSYIFVAR